MSDIERKRCTKCGELKPLEGGFSPRPDRPCGYYSACRACRCVRNPEAEARYMGTLAGRLVSAKRGARRRMRANRTEAGRLAAALVHDLAAAELERRRGRRGA